MEQFCKKKVETDGNNNDLLSKLADLYVLVYSQPPWNLEIAREETLGEFVNDLSSSKTQKSLSFFERDSKILAYTLGIIGDDNILIKEANDLLMGAAYFGKILDSKVAVNTLDKFWANIKTKTDGQKLLFVYDTLEDQAAKVSHEWFQTAIDVANDAISQGATQFIGFTLKNSVIYKILEKVCVITHTEEVDYKLGEDKGVLVFSDNLNKVLRIFKIAEKMSRLKQ